MFEIAQFLLPKLGNFTAGLIMIFVGAGFFLLSSYLRPVGLDKASMTIGAIIGILGLSIMFLLSWVEKLFSNVYTASATILALIIIGIGLALFKDEVF